MALTEKREKILALIADLEILTSQIEKLEGERDAQISVKENQARDDVEAIRSTCETQIKPLQDERVIKEAELKTEAIHSVEID